MRTAGMVMGIVGGAIALLFAILIIFGGLTFMNLGIWDGSYDYDYNFGTDLNIDSLDDLDNLHLDLDFDDYASDNDVYRDAQEMGVAFAGTIVLVFGIFTAISGVLGLVGGLIVKKKNVAAGVMMIIAAVLSLFNIISMALFILGAVFSLMRDRSKQQGYMPPYPMPPSYPQPTYPQPPQQSIPPQNPPENPQP